MEQLAFSYNWNKKLEGNCFTTLRLSDKYPPGTIVEVSCKTVKPFVARVVDRKKLTKPDLNEWICRLDTGYSRDETLEILHRMYPASHLKTPIYWHLLERAKEAATDPIPQLTNLLDMLLLNQA
jgi:hypothetical protein